MVHTFMISYNPTKEQARQIRKDYLEPEEQRSLLVEGKTIAISSNVPGIPSFSVSWNSFQGYTVTVSVEPQSLIMKRLTMEVFDCSDASKAVLKMELEKHLARLFNSVPSSLDEWSLSRIDYAVNLKSAYVEELVKLAKKGKDPYRYEDRIRKKGSAYRQSKSVTLNFYDKLDQLNKQQGLIQQHPHLEQEAANVFRIEVQCRKWSKIDHLRKKYHLPKNAGILDYLQPHIARDVITHYYSVVIGYDDYYTMHEAQKRVNEASQWRNRKKENLIAWLRLIAQARSVSEAREQFREGTTIKNTDIHVQGSDNTFNNYIKACREIKINPVTIPREWNIKRIGNPFAIK